MSTSKSSSICWLLVSCWNNNENMISLINWTMLWWLKLVSLYIKGFLNEECACFQAFHKELHNRILVIQTSLDKRLVNWLRWRRFTFFLSKHLAVSMNSFEQFMWEPLKMAPTTYCTMLFLTASLFVWVLSPWKEILTGSNYFLYDRSSEPQPFETN